MNSSMNYADPTLTISGRLQRSDGSWGDGEVWVAGRTIVAVHQSPQRPELRAGARHIDVGDDFILPGAIDAHVHSLSHSNEGVKAATSAAAAGGVTTIVEMPFDGQAPINSLDRLLTKKDLVNDEAVVDVAMLGTMAPGGGWRVAEDLAANGVVGFKVSLFLTDEIRFPRIDDFELLSVMQAAHDTGRTLCTHAENNEIVTSLLALEQDAEPTDPHAHARTRPPVSETLGVLTALEIAADRGTALHVCHLSLPRSIDLVGWYQEQGVDVTMETCPHYFTFSEEDVVTKKGRLKINPPIRSAVARDGMWDRVESGRVGIVSSDHAPWQPEFKDHERILDNASGAPGVETLVSVTLGQALKRDPSLASFGSVVDSLTIAPARRFGLAKEKGSLTVGKDADIMVFSPNTEATIDESTLHSNAGWSPFNGMAPGGVVSLTVSRGEVIWTTGGGLVGRSGRGDILNRTDC